MMLLSTSASVCFTLICGIIVTLYVFFKYTFSYWSRHGIWQFPTSIPLGNAGLIFLERKHLADFFKDYYNQLKALQRPVGGMYLLTTPVLLITDPEYVRDVLARNFSHFRDRGMWCNEEIDPLSANLLTLPAERWKRIRNMLIPFFTMSKIKLLFPTVEACGPNLLEMISEYSDKNEPIDMKNMIYRFTCQILGSCVFGFECNTKKDPNDIVFRVGKDIFEPESFIQALKRPCFFLMPNILQLLRIPNNSKFVTDFFFKLIKDTVEYREKNNVRRNDMMQILIDCRQKDIEGEAADGLTTNEMAAQCWIFFAGGFESAGGLATFCLFELSKNIEIQDKVRAEIIDVLQKYDGKFTFDAISKMKYLEAVVRETLRKYPTLPFLNRECTKDFTFPNSDITVRKGDAVVISNYGLQRDPDIYPDPEKFDPERFTEDSPKINPFTYLPFGEGPRNCIAYRFGLVQGKFTVAIMLKNFKFTFNDKTKMPFKLQKNTFTLSVDGGVWLNAERI